MPDILRALSPEELARRSQQGCRRSFAELAERYGISLFRFLRYKTNNIQDAEDLVQESFVRAYENIHRYNDSWKFSTWLFAIAARLASSYFRKSRSFQKIEDIGSSTSEPGQMVIDKETRQGLWALARGLSMNQYQALWLKYGQDMSIKEIARVLRKSQVNVKVLLYRARINLAKKLKNVDVENQVQVNTSSKQLLSLMKVEGA
ncbi:MAG: sigma-70 family RNA polymerase sigma factor [candidate division Zixibacteria bacterium]|nr:sigma-70 family RNA polymerase sigma factor [candidate division Zixibacteria bacterium]